MKTQIEKPRLKMKRKRTEHDNDQDIVEYCIQKGLIEKTPYGYYFKPEFFETLDIYENE